jgi:hypothetical protein
MMPYQAYLLYRIERPKSQAEIRRADDQRGKAAKSRSVLWRRVAEPIGIWRAPYREQRPALLTTRPLPTRGRARALSDQIQQAADVT